MVVFKALAILNPVAGTPGRREIEGRGHAGQQLVGPPSDTRARDAAVLGDVRLTTPTSSAGAERRLAGRAVRDGDQVTRDQPAAAVQGPAADKPADSCPS
jgi:hypothetical protein